VHDCEGRASVLEPDDTLIRLIAEVLLIHQRECMMERWERERGIKDAGRETRPTRD
jgi:hypothetical protein